MYEAVHVGSETPAEASRWVETAAAYGFDGVVLRRSVGEGVEGDDVPTPDHAALAEHHGIDVVDCVEILADEPADAAGAVGGFRPETTVVAVRGGTPALNRFAVEQDRVDALTRPLSGDGDFNHVLAKAAVEHDVRVEFDLGPALRTSGGSRVRSLEALRKLREVLDHYDAPLVVSANARSAYELRAPRELRALGEAVGFAGETVEAGLREWGRVAERNRERLSDSFVAPGVRLGRYEADAEQGGEATDGCDENGDRA